MCTILLLFRKHASYPVVVAANRDEFYSRKASKPIILSDNPRSIGGLDFQENGTWMGVNSHRIFAGLTNQRTHRLADSSLRSRGLIVRQVLQASSVEEIKSLILDIDPIQYNPFNLLFGDIDTTYVAYARRETTQVILEKMDHGVYVLANDRLGSLDFPKAFRAKKRALEVTDQPWDELKQSLINILSDHTYPSPGTIPDVPDSPLFSREILSRLQAMCIHSEVYGTCSATIFAISEDRVEHYLYADGPPCQTAFEKMTSLLYNT